jgi:predicted regulator of Ras-like GTPase activity (Roadblock/LC7/MglB family)
MAYAISRKESQRLTRVLQELLERAESSGCVLCDHSGYVLAQTGPDAEDPLLISALGAGVFAASRELARLLGEDKFSSVFHQGEKKSIFICAVTADVLLVIIFSNEASVGLVKLYAGPAAAAMGKVLEDVRVREETVDTPEHTFVLRVDEGGLFSKK